MAKHVTIGVLLMIASTVLHLTRAVRMSMDAKMSRADEPECNDGGNGQANLFLKGFGFDDADGWINIVQGADYSKVVLCPEALQEAVEKLIVSDTTIKQVLWDGDPLKEEVSFTWGFPQLFEKLREDNPGLVLTSKKLYKPEEDLTAYVQEKQAKLQKEYPMKLCPPQFKVTCNPDCKDYVAEAKDLGLSEEQLQGWKLLGQKSLREEEAPRIVLSQGGGITVRDELAVAATMGTESTWYILHLRRPAKPGENAATCTDAKAKANAKKEDAKTITGVWAELRKKEAKAEAEKLKKEAKDICKEIKKTCVHKAKLADKQDQMVKEALVNNEIKPNCPWNGAYDEPSKWDFDKVKVAPGYKLDTEDGSIDVPATLPLQEGEKASCSTSEKVTIEYRKYTIKEA